jgi:hypothetical protein
MGELEGHDPTRMRISDTERHHVAELLRQAAGEGRLDLEELDERLEATYAAKTYADLVPLTADLPVAPRPASPPTVRPAAGVPVGPTYDTSIAVLSGCDRRGAWVIGPTHHAFALMGGVTLDLREARFTSRETVINANTVMGGIDVVVGPHVHVVVEGMGIMGAFEQARDKVEADLDSTSPVVRVKGFALMGGVSVRRKPLPRGKRHRELGH